MTSQEEFIAAGVTAKLTGEIGVGARVRVRNGDGTFYPYAATVIDPSVGEHRWEIRYDDDPPHCMGFHVYEYDLELI